MRIAPAIRKKISKEVVGNYRQKKKMKKKFITAVVLALAVISVAIAFTACGDSNPPGTETYTFAAALTDLDDVEGEGFSGGEGGISMIAKDYDGEWETISGYYVSYLYVENTALTFEITSDRAVDDAKIVLSLSAEGKPEITIDPEIYTVSVNGTALDYAPITFYDIPNVVGEVYAFKQYTVGENISLQEGKNIIKLISSNNISMGGTTKATAPMVDCVQITTSAKLTWSPRTDNLDQFA